METQKTLQKLGLTRNEQEVYLSILKLGEITVGNVMKDIGRHRQSIYNALYELERQGLILKNKKNGVFHYKIIDPKAFIANIQNKVDAAKDLSKEIKKELEKTRTESAINIYDNQEKIRRYYKRKYENMEPGSTIFAFISYISKFEEVLGKEFFRGEYNRMMIKRDLKVKIITSEDRREEMQSLMRGVSGPQIRQIKYLPKLSLGPVTVEIVPQGVNLISLRKNWFIVEIKNKEIRDSYLEHFEKTWKIAQK